MTPSLTKPEYETVLSAAAYAEVSERTIRRWIETGLLAAKRTATRRVRIDRADLDRIIAPR